MTEFQIRYFLLGSEPTTQSKIRKCKLELEDRIKSFEAISLEIENQSDLFEIAKIKIKDFTSDQLSILQNRIDKRELEIKKQKIDSLLEKRESIKKEEILFTKILSELLLIEPEKDWESDFVQKEYWTQKLLNEFRVRKLLNITPEPELAKTMLSLPNSDLILKEISNGQNSIN